MGPALCLFSAACFGAMAVFGKYAFAEGVDVQTLLLTRFGLAAVLLTALVAGTRAARSRSTGRTPFRTPMTPTQVLVALGLGAFGYTAQAGLYFAALRTMDATLLALVYYTYPLLVCVGAVLIGRERFSAPRAIALLVAASGVGLVLSDLGGVSVSTGGLLMGFGSAVVYCVYILVSDRTVAAVPPLPLSALVMTGAAGAMLVQRLLGRGLDLDLSGRAWFWLGCIALVSTVLAMLSFFAGMRRTGPSTASTLSMFEPVVTAGLAAVALGETLTPLQLAGGLLVLLAIPLLQLRGFRRPALPDPEVPRAAVEVA